MRIIGLTGGIGSGKTTVALLFSKLKDVEIIDADVIAREIFKKNSSTMKELINFFGEKILAEDGNLNRKLLASIVFRDPESLAKLNEISHQAIHESFKKRLETLEKLNPEVLIIYDAPLLFETGFYKNTQKNILVSLAQNLQIERLKKDRGFTEKEILERINCQMTLPEKKKIG